MKKILLTVILFSASLLLFTTTPPPVHAASGDPVDYQDLFYSTKDIEFEILTSNTITSGTYDLFVANVSLNTPNDITDIYINDVRVGGQDVYNYADYILDESTNRILISESDYIDVMLIEILEDDTFNEIDYSFEIGDTVRIVSKKFKTWTQAHDYGRIRLEDTTRNMYLNKVDNEVFLSTTSPDNPNPENHKAFLDQPYENDKNFEIGTKVTLQSPYENFKIIHGSAGENVIVQKDNVSAVYLEKVAQPTSTERIYDITVFYWEDEELLSQVVEDVDLFGGVNLRIMFYGNIRKAIDYQDVMVANVDEQTPLVDFTNYIVAWDPIDGDISNQVYIVDDGDYASDVVSVYHVEFGVKNSNDLESTIIVPVHVVDIVAPVISGASDEVQIGYNQTFNVASWVASLTVSDNYYDGLTISLVTDTYTANKSQLGTYEITVRSVDPSGNETILTREINVVDGIGPVFSGIETITASINEQLTAEQIKGSLAAIDAIDGNVTSSISIDSDGLTGNNQTPGTYDVIFKAVDAAGNQTFYTVTATIVASPPGIYVIDSNSVRLLPGANLTIEQILDVLGASEAVGVSTDYDVNTPGVYNLSFTLGDVDYNMTINLLGVNDPILPDPIIPDAPSNFNAVYYLFGAALTVAVLIVVIKKRK